MARPARHRILALDLARRTGFALGSPGQRPRAGWVEFGQEGCSHEALFADAALWLAGVLNKYNPTTIVWEAPLPSSFLRGRTNAATTALLFGLPAVIGTTAFQRGYDDLRQAAPNEIRAYFIGRNMRSKEAEVAVRQRCRELGWISTSHDECDALALWAYQASILTPALAVVPTMPGIIRNQRVGVAHSHGNGT